STGKKVSSALDNPVNFFTAQSLSNRSSDLGTLLDSISNGVQTIQAANQGLTSIQKLVDSAKSTANQALATQITTTGTAAAAFSAAAGSVNLEVNGTAVSTTLTASDTIDTTIAKLNTAVSAQGAGNAFSKDVTGTKIVVNGTADIEFSSPADQTALGFTSGTANAGPQYGTTSTAGQSSNLTVTGVKERAALAKQYNSLLTQIDQLAKDSSFNGTNLLSSSAASNKLHISFNEKDTSNLDVQGVDATSGGLSLTSITGNSGATADGKGNFLLDSTVTSTLTSLTNASSTLRSQASTSGSNLSVVQNRQAFTKNLQTVLDTAASKPTDADLNEKPANSQARPPRHSPGISAPSRANQPSQAVFQPLR
ncbi:flagellar protein, partial [Methylobacterium sp. J-059]|uniref:flagellin N-terminal helical domain-containing protein n=1 Tax=Methylobacterium sp. J-059 TaxID=2836643 RepID=UPI001FBABF6A